MTSLRKAGSKLGALMSIVGVMLAALWAAVNYAPIDIPFQDPAVTGRFGPVHAWPLNPIHATALADGRVLTFGSDAAGRQGASMIYDVWDPSKGFGAAAHLTLPNTVGTDTFCAGVVVLPQADGKVLLAGGDVTLNGVRNYSSADINFFNPSQNRLEAFKSKMQRPRWYPTVLTLPSGDVLVAGGRTGKKFYTPDVEVYRKNEGWALLPQAVSEDAFGAANWSYPRMWVAPGNSVFVLSITGEMFSMNMAKGGQVSKLDVDKKLAGPSHAYLPSVMYRPGQILALRQWGNTISVDINGAKPQVIREERFGAARVNSTMTVLANGEVFLSGGELRDSSAHWYVWSNRFSKLWNPKDRAWREGPVARKMRLYHSMAMLMPDGTVLTGGGGEPGPENNLNVEVYYPPYLFKKDGSGEFAERPSIMQAPVTLNVGQQFGLEVKAEGVSRVTLIRAGSVTHTIGFDQRFMDLAWRSTEQQGKLQVTIPEQQPISPGFYYLFILDRSGVPSVSKMVLINPTA